MILLSTRYNLCDLYYVEIKANLHYWSIFASRNKNATSKEQHHENLLDPFNSLNNKSVAIDEVKGFCLICFSNACSRVGMVSTIRSRAAVLPSWIFCWFIENLGIKNFISFGITKQLSLFSQHER